MSERGAERQRARGRPRPRIENSAGGVVFRRDADTIRFLLIRDPYGNWGLPKGHIEASETPLEAALREVAEETALTEVRLEAELQCIDWYFRNRGKLIHKFCHFFLMESLGGEAAPAIDEGITECLWQPFDDAMRTISYDNAREVLRTAGEALGVAARPEPGSEPAA